MRNIAIGVVAVPLALIAVLSLAGCESNDIDRNGRPERVERIDELERNETRPGFDNCSPINGCR